MFTATYRLQLHSGFTFDDVRDIASYLRDLGVSHLYFSPYLQAAEGSTHGYDVVDHNRVNEELGGAEAHREMCRELGRLGLGQVLDIVPNHMAIGTPENQWWWDVLENGPSSRYAHFFDVEWDPPEKRMQNLVLVPVLGDHYGRILEAGQLRIVRERVRFVLRYHDHVLPVAPMSLPLLLGEAAVRTGSDDLAFLSDSFRALPLATATDAVSVARRHRDKEALTRLLAHLFESEPRIAAAVDQVIEEVNQDFDALDHLLSQQNYRLAYWRTAERELGYRRFFDINSLAGLRMEDERVFRETHRLILDWLERGVLDGVRIDHPDGLRNPEEYFHRLRAAAPKAWLLVEKILQPGEELRASWRVDGTTGYDFLFRVSNLFVDPAAEAPLTRIYADFTGRSTDYPRTARKRKEQILRETLGSDVNRLTADFLEVTARHRRFRDFTRHEIHHALRELIICFPVYRTYVRPEIRQVEPEDARYIGIAVEEAKRRRADLPPDLFDFLRSVLLLEVTGDVELEFVARFQQLTGAAMAKGVEDTAFYVFNRLSSLNEVGGDPSQFGITLEEFHRGNAHAQQHWPAAMLTTSTHDTKRSEDVRIRIHLLSEMPDAWERALRHWSALSARHKTAGMPDENMEYLFFQSLVGTWPIDPDRMCRYMEKCSREAKTHTSWTSPNPDYDAALEKFVRAVLSDAGITESVASFVEPLLAPAHVHSLSQTLLKLTSAGIPDLYQGSELWTGSLVDPDNRRPVDYRRRIELLHWLHNASPEQVTARGNEGAPKLFLIHKTLNLRRRRPDLFGASSTYEPVYAAGPHAHRVVAFARGGGALSIAPRLLLSLDGGWGETVIDVPSGGWINVLTEERVTSGRHSIADLLRRFPVALLERI